MADDTQHDQPPTDDTATESSAEETNAGHQTSQRSEDEAAGEHALSGEDEYDEDDEDDEDDFGGLGAGGFASERTPVFGTVTLHGRARDVTTVLDGESALRLLKIFEQRSNGTLADRLDVVRSSVHNAWLVADLDECIAVSWWPGLPRKAPRTAIDPAVDAI